MAQPRITSHNRKLPPLPDSHSALDVDDRRRWAKLFTDARLRKGWTYQALSAHSGVCSASVQHACTMGRCNSRTALKLLVALDLLLPTAYAIPTGIEAQRGQQAHAEYDHVGTA